MLTFKVTSPSSFHMLDYDYTTIGLHLASLPKAAYSSCSGKVPFIITAEAALRIMRVTHIKDHLGILEEIIAWNAATYGDQVLMSKHADDFCEISHSKTMLHGAMSMSIHRMSETESVYLTLFHDSEQVMMDIQLP
jgi:hypothetical protein